MAGFLVWAFSAIAVAPGLALVWALSAADPIGWFLRREPWAEWRIAGRSRNKTRLGPPAISGATATVSDPACPILTRSPIAI
jgi:hypothetical protein